LARWKEGKTSEAAVLLEEIPIEHRGFEWFLAQSEFNGTPFTLYCSDGGFFSEVFFTPDGRRLVTSGSSIIHWGASSGQVIRSRPANSREVGLSPDGTQLAVASDGDEGAIELLNADTDEVIHTLKGHHERVSDVDFDSTGRVVLSASDDCTIKLWDRATGQEIRTLIGHPSPVNSAVCSPDGTLIASSSDDCTVKIWDATAGKVVHTFKGDVPVQCVTFSPDGLSVAAGDSRGDIKLWGLTTGEEIRTMSLSDASIRCLVFSPDGSRIACGLHSQRFSFGEVKLLDIATGTELLSLKGHKEAVTDLRFSPDGTRIASASAGSIRIWDLSERSYQGIAGHTELGAWVNDLSFSRDGTVIASGSRDGTIKLWNTASGDEICTLRGHNSAITCVSFSPDGDRLVSGSFDETIKLWDTSTFREVQTYNARSVTTSVAFTPDGTRIVTGHFDSAPRLWDVVTGREILALRGSENSEFVGISADGLSIASANVFDETITLWDSLTGEEILTFGEPDQGYSLQGMCVNRDRSHIATLHWKQSGVTVKLWDTSRGAVIRRFNVAGGSSSDGGVSFSPDGRRLAVATGHSVHLWDVQTGRELRRQKSHSEDASCVTFNANGTTIASGGLDGKIVLWESLPDIANLWRRLEAPMPDWHEAQALAFEKEHNWYAACFHRAILVRLNPLGKWQHSDLRRVYEQLISGTNAKIGVLPPLVSETLMLPCGNDTSSLTEQLAVRFVKDVELSLRKADTADKSYRRWQLSRMDDVVEKFQRREFVRVRGLLQYRSGLFSAAIESMKLSMQLRAAETGDTKPSPFDLGMLVLSHLGLKEPEKAEQCYREFVMAARGSPWCLRSDLQSLIDEVEKARNPSSVLQEAIQISRFEDEASFEDLYQHHWQFGPHSISSASFAVVSTGAHGGKFCLQVTHDGSPSPLTAFQAVMVEPNARYRLTAWVRYEPDNTSAKVNRPLGGPDWNPPASVGLLNHLQSFKVSCCGWAPVTLEFSTTETEYTIFPYCRLDLGEYSKATAWFDDLNLEKLD
jgi:WD40 repeat protein